MPVLHTALQDGFNGDEVIMRVAGREVFRQPAVRTRTQIGLAATQDIAVDSGSVAIEVALPQRHIAQNLSLQVTKDTYLGLSVLPDGSLRHVVSDEPFGYV